MSFSAFSKFPNRLKINKKRIVAFGARYKFPIFLACFATIGAMAVLMTNAATPTASTEPEAGVISENAQVINDANASGGQGVKFGGGNSGEPTGWPAETSFSVCGNASILDGPSSAPTGAVVVSPGSDMAAATTSAPSGTTFYLTAGTHILPSGPVQVKTNNKYIGAPGAVLDGQFQVNYSGRSMAFRGGSSGVTIQYLTIKNFGQADGKMASMINQTAINWSQGQSWTIANNTISKNGGAGVWVSTNSKLQNNCIEENEQTGVAVPSTGSTTQTVNALIENNEIRNNNPTNAIETVGVCTGCAGGMKIWNSKGTIVRNNRVTGNKGAGIWVDNNNIDTLVEGNIAKDNLRYGIYIEISYSAIVRKNFVKGNYVTQGSGAGSFPHGGIYISNSGGDEATKTYLGGTFPAEISVNNNYVVDNWNGINLWEDAGRYCTENDTSNCPPLITNPTDQCVTNLSANADVCRWKTKNVKVHNNTFEMSTTVRSSWCPTSNTNCARNALISNMGPAGTPYAGTAIQTAISRNQNNSFYNNIYVNGWTFSVPDSGSKLIKDIWQSTWGQDASSDFSNN